MGDCWSAHLRGRRRGRKSSQKSKIPNYCSNRPLPRLRWQEKVLLLRTAISLAYGAKAQIMSTEVSKELLNRSKRRKQRQSFFSSDKRVVIQRAYRSPQMKLIQGNRSRNLNLCYLCLLLLKNSLLTSVSECVYHFCNSAPARSQHQQQMPSLKVRPTCWS